MAVEKETIHSLIHGVINKGEKFDAGCEINEIDHYISVCNSINPDKYVCVVKQWQWWDLDVGQKLAEIFSSVGQSPCVIKADYVIYDQVGRFNEGDWVRTSLLLRFHENCIFETPNTFYLLVSEGTRKNIDAGLAGAMF